MTNLNGEWSLPQMDLTKNELFTVNVFAVNVYAVIAFLAMTRKQYLHKPKDHAIGRILAVRITCRPSELRFLTVWTVQMVYDPDSLAFK